MLTQDRDLRKPADVGVDPRSILNWIERMEKEKIGIHSFQIRRHDALIAEAAYEPYSLDGRHVLYSLSKSFTATAIGFAVQEGLLTVEDKLMSFFPDTLPAKPCPNMEKITLRHLLSMNSGHQDEPEIFAEDPRWTYNFLSSYIPHEPGSHFLYNTAATYMLSAVVTIVSGQTCHDYLKSRLYEPLGFSSDPWWELSPEGYNTGGFGLNLSVRDIGRFAQFCLHEGEWEGHQLLPAAWFREASHTWSDNSGGKDATGNEWGQGYGYQFWICSPEGVYRGDGACGQFAIMMPKQNMTIAITSGTSDLGGVMKGIWEEILPVLADEALAETDELMKAQAELEAKLSELRLWTPDLPGRSTDLEQVLADVEPARIFELSGNERGVRKLRFSDDYLEIMMEDADWTRLPLDAACWTTVELAIAGDPTLDNDHYKSPGKRQRSTSPAFPSMLSLVVYPRMDDAGRPFLLLDLAFTETPLLERWHVYATKEHVKINMERISGFGESVDRVLGIPETK